MRAYNRERALKRLKDTGVFDENGDPTIAFNNPLEWWATHQRDYPILSALARSVLCVPATSAPVERLFSYAGLTIANDRASLLPENAAEIIFLRVAWPKTEQLLRAKRKREGE